MCTNWHSFMECQHDKNRQTWILCRRPFYAWRKYFEIEPTGNYLMKRMLKGMSNVLLALAWKEWARLRRSPTTKYHVKLCEVSKKLLVTNVFKGWCWSHGESKRGRVENREWMGKYVRWMFTSCTGEELQFMSRIYHHWCLQVMSSKHMHAMHVEKHLKEEVTDQWINAKTEMKHIQGQLHKETQVKEELGLQLNTAREALKNPNVFNHVATPLRTPDKGRYGSPFSARQVVQSYMSRRGADAGIGLSLDSYSRHRGGIRVESVRDMGSESGANASHLSNNESEITQGNDFDYNVVTGHENFSSLDTEFGGTHSSTMDSTFKNLLAYVDEDNTPAQVISSNKSQPDKVTERASVVRSGSDEDDHYSMFALQGDGRRLNRSSRPVRSGLSREK